MIYYPARGDEVAGREGGVGRRELGSVMGKDRGYLAFEIRGTVIEC